MYGLSSRESLSKRQSRWIRDVDESLRNNPPINSSTNVNISSERNNAIISSKQSYYTDSNISLSSRNNSLLMKNISNVNDDIYPNITNLNDQISILSQKYSNLKDKIKVLHDKLSLRIDNLETQQIKYQKLQDSLVSDYQKLQDSLVSDYHHKTENSLVSDYHHKSENSLVSDYQEFVPFFIKEEYSGRDIINILNKNNMDMTVDIVGLFNETPIIYPFGVSKDLPNFIDLNLDMKFEDPEKSINGIIYGNFTKRKDGIYIIQITELYYNGELSDINNFTLKLTITCCTDLISYP